MVGQTRGYAYLREFLHSETRLKEIEGWSSPQEHEFIYSRTCDNWDLFSDGVAIPGLMHVLLHEPGDFYTA